jgi:hypothetical protein
MESRTDEDGFREWLAQRGLLCRDGDETRDLQAQRERVAALEQAVTYIERRLLLHTSTTSTHATAVDYRQRLDDAYAVLVNLASTP